jgi:hypothetical protein
VKKFLVLYKAPLESYQQMMNATPEQAKAGMAAWTAWAQKAGSAIVDLGAPLGKSVKVEPGSISPTENDLGGYSIMQAESKEALAKTMEGHPHFMTPKGTIEIVECMALPGM